MELTSVDLWYVLTSLGLKSSGHSSTFILKEIDDPEELWKKEISLNMVINNS